MTEEVPAHYGGDPVREAVLGYGGQSITEREKEAVLEALEGDYITRGPTVDEFEERVADLVGVEHAIATTSGTTALHLAGEAVSFGPGDEVITTPLTFAATAYTATYCDAKPVFADVNRDTRTLDPDSVRNKITDDTAAIIPMHYGGHPADIEEFLSIADEHDLTVLWDACHAIGGTWRSEPIGAQRDLAVFSFHPVKTITTGEGGMIVTDNDAIAEKARRLRSFDMNRNPEGHEDEPWYQVVEGEGYNYNVTDFQAALGLAQLERIEEFSERRKELVTRYDEALADFDGIRIPPEPEDADPTCHLYAVEIGEEFGCDRGEFVRAMHDENISVQVHYVPLHYHPYFQKEFGYERGDFPVAEQCYNRLVSLPLFPAMSNTDQEDVIEAIDRIHGYHSE